MTENQSQSTEVEIFGNTYTIKGNEDPEYIRELAKYVSQQMYAVTHQTATISPGKAAVLVALNVTDELFKTKRIVEEKTRELTEKVDSYLK
ncbi:cell division protein ZapA [bacterium]|nr:cell division protein ZapA [bacterium]